MAVFGALGRLFGAPGSPAFDGLPPGEEVRRMIAAGPGRNVAVTAADERDARLRPVVLAYDHEQARARVLAAVASLRGWKLAAFHDRVVWATRTTPMLGFVDDVLILLTPDSRGTRIEARSASRVGEGDLGRNRGTLRELGDVLRRWT